MLEGERDGLPIFCSQMTNLRLRGRAIPARMVLPPNAINLASSEIQWVEISPRSDTPDWQRRHLPRGDNRWNLAVQEFHGTPAPGLLRSLGTMRFAAAIQLESGALETDGWSIRPDWNDPERSPGLRVSRRLGESMSGRAIAFARLPLRGTASMTHARNKVALKPMFWLFAAYEDLAGVRLTGPFEKGIDDEAWGWLFEVVVAGAKRGEGPGDYAVGPGGTGVAWADRRNVAGPGVRANDLVVFPSGDVAILRTDDGDGWLDNDDEAIHLAAGHVSQGPIAPIEGRSLTVLRCRDFSQLRVLLREAGYGEKLANSWMFGPDLKRSCREFERDHGLPVDGRPDPELVASVTEFVFRLHNPLPAPVGDDTE